MARGSARERGYDSAHEAERAKWAVKVEAGGVECARAAVGECVEDSPLIDPDQPWDLGHTEDRKGWTGPEHVKCNRSAGGRRGNRLARERAQMVVRDWR
jgi:hypothetical protein